jgi:uncharacterized protein YecE (DUF72 family)
MGFSYKQWIGPFYPDGLPARLHLTYYAERLNALEMDSTFYGTPTAKAVERWASAAPDGFQICPKMPRAITHDNRLVAVSELTTTFLERMRLLGDRLGPILIQFPPDFTMAEVSTLTDFLSQLPLDLRFVVEFRHRSWDKTETAVLLQTKNICWAAVDYIYMPRRIVQTTDFLYLRFLGPRGRFPAKDRQMVDRSADLEQWWQNLQPHLEHVQKIYAFFNDDYSGFSPQTCNHFKEIIGQDVEDIWPMQQGRLF